MQKRSLLPLGERAAATKWCLSGPGLQWRDGRGRIRAGPARSRVLVPREGGSGWRGRGRRRGAGQGAAAGASALTLTPTRAHSQLRCCRRRLEAAGALKARLLPAASAAPGLVPSSAGGRGRGCGCSLLQWGARSREPAPGQQAASRQVHAKTRDALWQPPSNRATRRRAAFTRAPRVPSSLPCSGHLRFRTAKRSRSPGGGRETTVRSLSLTLV